MSALPAPPAAGTDEPSEPEQSSSRASALVTLAEGIELFHSPDGTAFATIENGVHRETWPLRSRTFRNWLSGMHWRAYRSVAGSRATEDARGILEARAMFEGPELAVAVRLAEYNGRVYLDLGRGDWEAVLVGPEGWAVVSDVPVRFRRPKGLGALPIPLRGGSVELLREFVNIRDDDQWRLLVAWLVAALRPSGPYPVLALNGEQGSAKSTTAKVLRLLVDPNKSPNRAAPRDERDLAIAANNGWIVSHDNLSGVPDWLSDAYCRLSTGAGFGTRTLYENDEETLFDACRPIVLNGIGAIASRSDLLDRAILLELPRIGDDARRSESEFWATYETQRPLILGALLDVVAAALGTVHTVRLARLPRMADFAQWAVAAEPALGWTEGSFIAAYQANRGDSVDLGLDASPIYEPLLAVLVSANGRWYGTSSDLFDALAFQASEQVLRSRAWPRSGRGLTTELTRLAPGLRSVGIEIERAPREAHRRPIVITQQRSVTNVTNVTPNEPAHSAQSSRADPLRVTALVGARHDTDDTPDTSLQALNPEKRWRCSVDLGTGHVLGRRADGSTYCATCHPLDLGNGASLPIWPVPGGLT